MLYQDLISNPDVRTILINKLEMCSIAQEGERASPAQQPGSQLIGCHFLVATLVDKHAHILEMCSVSTNGEQASPDTT